MENTTAPQPPINSSAPAPTESASPAQTTAPAVSIGSPTSSVSQPMTKPSAAGGGTGKMIFFVVGFLVGVIVSVVSGYMMLTQAPDLLPRGTTATPAPKMMPSTPPEDEQVFCTLDAKICPDGSAVGRVAPSCEFAACPGEEANGENSDPLNIDLNINLNESATTPAETPVTTPAM